MLETERLLLLKFTPEDLGNLSKRAPVKKLSNISAVKICKIPQRFKKRLQFYIDCYEKFGYGMGAMNLEEIG